MPVIAKLMKEKEREKRSNKFLTVLGRIGKLWIIFLFVFVFVYIGLNYEALYTKLKFWYQSDITNSQFKNPNQTLVSQLPSPYLSENGSWQLPTTTDKKAKESISIANNQLYIPKIDVRAPIIWNIEADMAIDRLRDGVVHIKPTALPGDYHGNVFITGHSSYYPWDPGKYKQIFSLLPDLKKGDQIYIQSHNSLFKYQVFQKMVVKPEETWVMKPIDRSIVSLMTCVPIGTSLRRYIVRAEQISPSPAAGGKKQQQKQTEKEITNDLMPRIFN